MAYATWLPDLIELSSFSGNWDKYCEAIYSIFCEDFKNEKVRFRKWEINIKSDPIYEGKEASFWHCISEGEIEDARNIDLDRCKRIKWPKSVIIHDGSNDIKIWSNTRKNKQSYVLLVEKDRYCIVLRLLGKNLFLWTAYTVEQNHRLRKMQKEYEEYIKNNAAG